MSQNIKKDYIWNTIGVFVQNAISPLLLIVVTRINGIYDSGLFSFAFSLAVIFWAISMWGGRTFQVSDVKREFSSQSYIAARLILAVLVLVGALIFSLANNYDTEKVYLIMALVAVKVIESIADVLYGVLQKHNRLYVTGKSLTYKAIVGFSLFVLIDVCTEDIILSSLGLIVSNIIFLVCYDLVRALKIEKLSIQLGQFKEVAHEAIRIMKRCAPVFIMTLLAMFSLNIPRYFLDIYHEDQIGHFGIIAMPITLIVLVMSFILQPNVVQLAHLGQRGEYDKFNKIVKRIVTVTMGIGLVILLTTYLIGVQALEIIFGVEFSIYKFALIVIVIGAIINALVAILMNVLVIMRHFKIQFYILLATNVVLACVSPVIIERSGLSGAAILFTLTNVVQLILLNITYTNLRNKVKV